MAVTIAGQAVYRSACAATLAFCALVDGRLRRGGNTPANVDGPDIVVHLRLAKRVFS